MGDVIRVLDTGRVVVWHGDCLDRLRQMPDDSVDSVVTDPPYGLAEHSRRNVERALLAWLTGDREHVPDGRGFMGRDWDRFVPPPAVWDECFRVLKPGGHLLAFCAPRTYDLMAISIRLAGLTEDAVPEIRDCITWIMSQGFPKSLDVGKAIDKRPGRISLLKFAEHLRSRREARGLSRADVSERVVGSRSGAVWNWEHGIRFPEFKWWPSLRDLLDLDPAWEGVLAEAEREVLETRRDSGGRAVTILGTEPQDYDITAPATEDAARWDGWGTGLKPASEPIVVARKPLAGTVAANVLTHGTGALNIDATRVEAVGRPLIVSRNEESAAVYGDGLNGSRRGGRTDAGRWPSNVVLTHAPDCEPVGTRKVRGSRIDKPADATPTERPWAGGAFNAPRPACGHGDEDGTETVEAWECVPGCPVAELNAQSGNRPSTGRPGRPARPGVGTTGGYGGALGLDVQGPLYSDEGGASRFFPTFRYQAKAGRKERPRILILAEWCACGHRATEDHDDDGCHAEYGAADGTGPCPCEGVHDTTVERRWVAHPTVKPLTLIRWLVRLVTPPGGTVLDLFAGTGTTGEACQLDGFRCDLIERDPESIPLILDRLTRRTDPVAHLTAKARRGEDVDLGLFGLLDDTGGGDPA